MTTVTRVRVRSIAQATLCGAAIAFACTPGPAYHLPTAPVPSAASYKETLGVWKVASPADGIPRGRWWQMFHDTELDELEARSNVDNQTIAQASENYQAARAQIRAARSQYFPTVTAAPAVNWYRTSATFAGSAAQASAPTSTPTSASVPGSRIVSYALPVEASWAPDLFGRVRSTVHQTQYNAQVRAADLESTRLLVQAMLAETFFQLRGQDALIGVLEGLIKTNEEIVGLTRSRYEGGVDSEVSYVAAQATLANVRVQATNAGILRAQYEHAIATLLGVPATTFSLPRRALLATPPAIPTGAPSQLLERRPDIAAAERQMASANATIGIGYAAYYPVVTLNGDAGLLSSTLETLLSWPSRVWSIGATLSETVFDGGLRRATIDQYRAQYNANVAAYRQTVLAAFQQVEDFLAQLRILATSIEQQVVAVGLARRALELATARYRDGLDPYLNVMTQQTALLAAEETLVTLQVARMVAAVLLVHNLGGGWDRSQLPTPSEVSRSSPRSH